MTLGRAPLWFAMAGLATFGVNLLFSAISGFSLDESWYLQLVDRVIRGDTLYQHVFFLSTPLSVQITGGLAHLFGSAILVEKAVASACFVGEIAFATLMAREYGVARRHLWLVWLAVFIYAQHFPNPPYRGLGSALMFGAFWTLAAWLVRRPHADRWLVATGALAGACFAAMPNHGLLTAAAVAVVVVLQQRLRRQSMAVTVRSLALIAAAFVAVVVVVLAPVVADGAVRPMVEDVFLNKADYVRFGGASYWADVRSVLAFDPRAPLASAGHLYRGLVTLLAPIAIVGLIGEWRRSGSDRRVQAMALLLLAVIGFVGAYPRLNRFHLSYAAPGLVVGLAFSASTWRRWLAIGPRTAHAVVAVWLLAGVAATTLDVVRAVRSDANVWCTLPHFEHVLIARVDQETIRANAERMAAVLPSSTLMVTLQAGIYYLVTDLRNPTPYDQSIEHNFGPHGQDDVVAALASGALGPVCVAPIPAPLGPAKIQDYVKAHMIRGEDLGVCTIYR